MTKERESNDVEPNYSSVDSALADINRLGRQRSAEQLAYLLPSAQIQKMMEFVSHTFPDVVISPRLPIGTEELHRLQITNLTDLGEVSSFGEEAVETGLGWRFEPRGESGFSYSGVRILSFPEHIVIAGATPQRIAINRAKMGSREKIEVCEAFKSVAMRSPGRHHLSRNKMNPKVRV